MYKATTLVQNVKSTLMNITAPRVNVILRFLWGAISIWVLIVIEASL